MIFALLFRFLPDARARWRDIWAGAIFTSLLFGLGRYVIGLYIGNSDFSSTYGAAGALVTLLVVDVLQQSDPLPRCRVYRYLG